MVVSLGVFFEILEIIDSEVVTISLIFPFSELGSVMNFVYSA